MKVVFRAVLVVATAALLCSGSDPHKIFGNWTINPPYGPEAGGTPIVVTYSVANPVRCDGMRLTGYQFATVPNARPVDISTCQQTLSIVSPPYKRSESVDVKLCFTVITSVVPNNNNNNNNTTISPSASSTSSYTTSSTEKYCSNVGLTFTYKPNPIVNWTTGGHLNTILAGGITQIIYGSNFDSASHYSLKLVASDSGALPQQSSCRLCAKASSLWCLKCQTPPVGRQMGFKDDNSSTITHEDAVMHTAWSRNIVAEVVMDGWSTNTSMLVYKNPGVQQLVPEEQEYACNHDIRIQIGVLWPAFDVSIDDIRVDVVARAFEGPCSDVIVLANKTITCLPPRVPIPVIRYSLQEARTAEVKVTIGGMTAVAGRLIYVIEEPFNVIMIVMLAIIAFIIIVSTVCGCVTLFHRQCESCCPCCCTPSGSAKKGHNYQPFEGNAATEEQDATSAEPNGADGSSKWSLKRKGKSGRYSLHSAEGKSSDSAANNGERTKKQSFDIEMFSQKARDDTYY